MTSIDFTSTEEDDYFLVPYVELRERSTSLTAGDNSGLALPDAFCGLEEPTLHETLGILRFLAFRLARVMHITEHPEGLVWFESYNEETTFDDYLEVATAILAALQTSVVSTSANGEIVVDFLPIIEDIKQFFQDDFIPIAHYLRASNPDGIDDFEYDFDDAFIGDDALREIYLFRYFHDVKRIVDLDPIFRLGGDGEEMEVVAVNKHRPTPEAVRDFSSPLDRILLSIISVVQFFKRSLELDEGGSAEDYDEPTIEELEKNKWEYIEEFPDEVEIAEESYQEDLNGVVYDFEFCAESAVLRDLGIISISEHQDGDSQGWLRATLSLPLDQLEHVGKLGFSSDEDETYEDPFVDHEPVGRLRLGWYEYYFFTPNEDEA